MMQFGKRKSYDITDNRIIITFENQTGIVEIVTESIMNIFSPFESEEHRSKAIEGDKTVKTEFTAEDKQDCIEIKTNKIIARVYDDFKVDFYNTDNVLLCADYRQARLLGEGLSDELKAFIEGEGHKVDDNTASHAIEIMKKFDGDECFYGLGDKAGFLNKRDYDYVMWNTDDPSPHVDSYKSLYKSIPFFIALKKTGVFGIFFDNTYRSVFNMGNESQKYYWFGADKGNLDYYYIAGDSMIEVLKGYTYLTGTVPVPQKWTLGYHQSRWGYTDQKDMEEVATAMRNLDIPCDAIHFDIDYMDAYKVFTWNKQRYENPKNFLETLKEDGFKVVTIIDPGVKQEKGYEVYEEGVAKGYFAKDTSGEIYVNEVWPGESVYPDFGSKDVRAWWADKHEFLTDMGVAGVWNDMNEPASFKGELPLDVVFTDEDKISNHEAMHNVYGHNMCKATYEGLKKHDGKRPFVITRACYSGSQKYTTGWTGDNHSLWAHLQMAIPQLCNLGLSGMSFVGTDIGGFNSDCTPELMIRWIQVGCFSPLCRNHSALGTKRQEPWQYEKNVQDIYRKYVKLRYKFIPYYYDLFFQGEKTGMPVMRPLVLHYEKDENTKNCNGEFLIGENLLVAPVVEQGATQKMVYLPAGEWYDYWTKEKITGGTYILREAPLDVCPMFVKAGSVLPNALPQSYVGEKVMDTLILDVYPGQGSYDHFEDNGSDFDYRKGAYNQYHIEIKEDTLTVKKVQKGYDSTYKTLCVNCLGKTIEVPMEDEITLTLK